MRTVKCHVSGGPFHSLLATMFQPILLILFGSTVIHATNVPPPPISLGVTDSLLASRNATLDLDRPDYRFHVTPLIGSELIPHTPTLMSILYFMAELSSKDHNDFVAPNLWNAPGASEVTIVTRGTIQAKYLLWGVFAGIEYMIKYSRFHEVLLRLRWESMIVGEIWLVPSKSIPNLAVNTSTQTLEQRSNTPRAEHNGTSIEEVLADPHVANETNALDPDISIGIESLPGGGPLTRFDVFLVCYAALLHMSLAKPDSQLEDFVSTSPLKDVFLYMYKWGPGVEVHRAIQLMVFLPRSMLKSPLGFREVTFNLRVNGRSVLEGTLKKGTVHQVLKRSM